MDYKEIVEAELQAHDIALCPGCNIYGSHTRGRADSETRIIHLSASFATRTTLYRFLHEVGHLVKDQNGLPRWKREAEAEDYARLSFKQLGLSTPRRMVNSGNRYVSRMKSWGKAIKRGRK